MSTPDYWPTRLAGGIQAAIEYIDVLAQLRDKDKIVLVAFNHAAKIVHPFLNIECKDEVIYGLRDLRADSGTDIAEGLKKAAELFADEICSGVRQIILLTDEHGGRPIRIARTLKEKYNAIIDVVGIGGSHSAVDESLLRKVAYN